MEIIAVIWVGSTRNCQLTNLCLTACMEPHRYGNGARHSLQPCLVVLSLPERDQDPRQGSIEQKQPYKSCTSGMLFAQFQAGRMAARGIVYWETCEAEGKLEIESITLDKKGEEAKDHGSSLVLRVWLEKFRCVLQKPQRLTLKTRHKRATHRSTVCSSLGTLISNHLEANFMLYID